MPEGPPQNCVTGNITGKSFSISWDPPNVVTGKFSYRVELYGPSGKSQSVLCLSFGVRIMQNMLILSNFLKVSWSFL